jgi:hypothetical protein
VIGRILGMGAIVALCLLSAEQAMAGDPNRGPLQLHWQGKTLAWTDTEGEASYHITVDLLYWPSASCIGAGPKIDSQRVQASETLAADTTTFAAPPSDPRLTWIKESVVNLRALDDNGNVLATDGWAATADLVCTPEEIAAELAAAGTGPGASRGGLGLALLSVLLGLGAAGIAGGALMRRIAS